MQKGDKRKILSYAQNRKGPNKVGFLGLIQPLLDGVETNRSPFDFAEGEIGEQPLPPVEAEQPGVPEPDEGKALNRGMVIKIAAIEVSEAVRKQQKQKLSQAKFSPQKMDLHEAALARLKTEATSHWQTVFIMKLCTQKKRRENAE
ncbi:unnamed protein product, partial [Didymodactylos carnosus]